jgi:hypothetical protein
MTSFKISDGFMGREIGEFGVKNESRYLRRNCLFIQSLQASAVKEGDDWESDSDQSVVLESRRFGYSPEKVFGEEEGVVDSWSSNT